MPKQSGQRAGNKKRNKRFSVLWVFVSVLIVAYLGIAVYFTGHFLFNTYVNDIYAYKMTAADIEREVVAELKNYKLVVNSRGGISDEITSDDIQLNLRMTDQFKNALKEQNPFLWPGYLFKETHLTTENIVDYSEEVLKSKIEAFDVFDDSNVVTPVDAHISEETGEDGFYVVAEDPGQTPIKAKVIDKVKEALDVLEAEVTLDDGCYLEAKIKSDDETLKTLCDNLNNYCKAKITYVFGNETVNVDGVDIKEWCDISGTNVTLDNDKVREFVNSIARKYDTFGKTRTLTKHDGTTVEIEGGDYGWWMDRSTETSELIDAIKEGEKTERTPVYFGTAAVYGAEDWGDSYVEIDLDNQHLWVYENGQVVEESDFVSGCVNKGRMTPRGTYGITYKERNATLVGENYSSAVSYWMPFNGNVGMHDATWRSEFGGELYVANGSHGCINLPIDKAASIYEIVQKGEAVLVYGGKTVPEIVPPENPEGEPVVGEDGTVQTPDEGGEAAPVENVPAENPVPEVQEAQESAAEENPVETVPEQDGQN